MGANAQTSVPTFTAGEVLTAANMNISARTGVPVFATTTTRDAAFGGTGEKTLAEGQMCYIEAAPKRLQVYNGTAWLDYDAEYTSFTPTISGYTRGNGTSQARYVRLGKFVSVYVREVLGSTSSMSSSPVITLPVTASQVGAISPASVILLDAGTAYYFGNTFTTSTSSVTLRAVSTTGTYAVEVGISATAPMTWTTGDEFQVTINYEAA